VAGFGAPWALDSSNWIAAVWGREELLPWCNIYEHSHIALSFHKYSFQAKSPTFWWRGYHLPLACFGRKEVAHCVADQLLNVPWF